MTSMKMPSWYNDAKKEMEGSFDETPQDVSFRPSYLELVEDYPNLFAEYELRDQDLLLHLFPRGGLEDRWSDGHYIGRCHNCRREVELPSKPAELKPCPNCQRTGLVYIPGRGEDKAEVSFPENAKTLIKEATDVAWLGEVAIDFVEELGAYVVQFQKAVTTVKLVGSRKFVYSVCDALNDMLGEKH